MDLQVPFLLSQVLQIEQIFLVSTSLLRKINNRFQEKILHILFFYVGIFLNFIDF
jgi:hypothetical protein